MRLAWIIPASVCLWILILAGFALLLRNPIRPPSAPELQITLADMSSGVAAGGHGGGAKGEGYGLGVVKTRTGLASGARSAATPSHVAALANPRAQRTRKRVALMSRNEKSNLARPLTNRREEDLETRLPQHELYAKREPQVAEPVAGAQSKNQQTAHPTLASLQRETQTANGGNGTGSGIGAGAANGSGGRGESAGSGNGEGDHVYDTVEHPPVPISRVLPVYPGAARAQGLEGEVVLRAIVDQHGAVERNIVVVESIPLLDAAAIEALRQWRFEPGRDANHRPVRVLIEVPLRFRLR
jgi:TonB family protein